MSKETMTTAEACAFWSVSQRLMTDWVGSCVLRPIEATYNDHYFWADDVWGMAPDRVRLLKDVRFVDMLEARKIVCVLPGTLIKWAEQGVITRIRLRTADGSPNGMYRFAEPELVEAMRLSRKFYKQTSIDRLQQAAKIPDEVLWRWVETKALKVTRGRRFSLALPSNVRRCLVNDMYVGL